LRPVSLLQATSASTQLPLLPSNSTTLGTAPLLRSSGAAKRYRGRKAVAGIRDRADEERRQLLARLPPGPAEAANLATVGIHCRWGDVRHLCSRYRAEASCVWQITDFPRISNSPHTCCTTQLSAPNSASRARNLSAFTSYAPTNHPFCQNRCAVSRPIPDAAPVIKIDFAVVGGSHMLLQVLLLRVQHNRNPKPLASDCAATELLELTALAEGFLAVGTRRYTRLLVA